MISISYQLSFTKGFKGQNTKDLRVKRPRADWLRWVLLEDRNEIFKIVIGQGRKLETLSNKWKRNFRVWQKANLDQFLIKIFVELRFACNKLITSRFYFYKILVLVLFLIFFSFLQSAKYKSLTLNVNFRSKRQTSGGPEMAQVLKDILFPPNANALRLINFICQSYLHLKVVLVTCFTTNTINIFLLPVCFELPYFQTLIEPQGGLLPVELDLQL